MHSARAAACRGAGGGPAHAGIDCRAPEAARPSQDSGGRRIAAGTPSRPFFLNSYARAERTASPRCTRART